MGPPQKETEYLVASTCSPKLVEHLAGFKISLWHIFDNEEEGFRIIPHGDWQVTGGCSVGVRTMTLARFLGFTDLHVFGNSLSAVTSVLSMPRKSDSSTSNFCFGEICVSSFRIVERS